MSVILTLADRTGSDGRVIDIYPLRAAKFELM